MEQWAVEHVEQVVTEHACFAVHQSSLRHLEKCALEQQQQCQRKMDIETSHPRNEMIESMLIVELRVELAI